MTTIIEIEDAVKKLPENDLLKFRSWFSSFDQNKWDNEFESDVKSGTFDSLCSEALNEYNNGKCKEL